MPDYQCQICYKKFSQKSNYFTHINRKYKCQKPIIYEEPIQEETNCCVFCKKQYSSKGMLKRHIENNCKTKKKLDNDKNNNVNMEIDPKIDIKHTRILKIETDTNLIIKILPNINLTFSIQTQ